jgi:hydrogenase expression/formation protein HypE
MSDQKNSVSGGLVCPVPLQKYQQVLLAHGSGGKLTNELIGEMIAPAFSNKYLEPLHDGAVLGLSGNKIAFSTDSYVINPIFFPGGDIGRLAINGTVNDLAMCGAQPLWLSAGFIIEEGFSMEDLARIVQSMQAAAKEAGVAIVTGDTKVVDRGKGDKLYINTAGIGLVPDNLDISPRKARAGDRIILNGPIGLHGIAIMSIREGLQFETTM